MTETPEVYTVAIPTTAQRIAAAIQAFTAEKHYPPTFRELGELIHEPSVGNVYAACERARERGLIVWERGKGRTLRVRQ